MGLPQNEVAADNQRRRIEALPNSPAGDAIGETISLAGPMLAVSSTLASSGTSSATGLVVAGSIVAGLGIVDWFRKLGSSKVNENLQALGQATEDALIRVENVLREQGTSIEEIKARIDSPEFKDGMASASLQALRTTQGDRLKRLALILANGVKEGNLEPESLDDMMRAAVELKDEDIILLRKLCGSQNDLLIRTRQHPQLWRSDFEKVWNIFVQAGNLNSQEHLHYRSSFSRLESEGLVQHIPDGGQYGVGHDQYALLMEGKQFYERLQQIAVE